MKIFGPYPWGPARDGSVPFVPIPVGAICAWCDEPIVEGEEGVLLPVHRDDGPPGEIVHHKECQARSILGSVGHQRQMCSCYGGCIEDPDLMTRREAAQAALAYCEWKARGKVYDA